MPDYSYRSSRGLRGHAGRSHRPLHPPSSAPRPVSVRPPLPTTWHVGDCRTLSPPRGGRRRHRISHSGHREHQFRPAIRPRASAEAVFFAPERFASIYLDRLLGGSATETAVPLLAAPSTLRPDLRFFDAEAFTPATSTPHSAARPAVVLDVPHIWCGWSKLHSSCRRESVSPRRRTANLRNTKTSSTPLRKCGNDPPPRLVINQAASRSGRKFAIADFSGHFGIEPMSVIPFEPQLFGQRRPTNGRMLGEIGCAECHPFQSIK